MYFPESGHPAYGIFRAIVKDATDIDQGAPSQVRINDTCFMALAGAWETCSCPHVRIAACTRAGFLEQVELMQQLAIAWGQLSSSLIEGWDATRSQGAMQQ